MPKILICRFVDKAIKATVIGHLFGDESSLLNASIDTTIREDPSEPGNIWTIWFYYVIGLVIC